MRNFINIVSSQQELLLEGRQYRDMLTAFENLAERHPDARTIVMDEVVEIGKICDSLKRKDRQIWAARILRLECLSALLDSKKARDNPEFGSDVSTLIQKYQADYAKMAGHPFTLENTIMYNIEKVLVKHFLKIPYAPIQQYVFQPSKTYGEIVADLTHLEDNFKELSAGLVKVQPGDTTLMTFSNGYCWMLLPRQWCKEEGEAMGHCGNGGGTRGDRILSLRQFAHNFDGVQYYHPYLTFILNSDGKLGEMKGRGNDKPVDRYHTYITALLKNDLIKGIVGGGYMPENNFSLDDLPEGEADELIRAKPSLGTLRQQIDLLGDTKEVRESALVVVRAGFGNACSINEDGLFVVKQWEGIAELVNELCGEEWWDEAVGDGGAFDNWPHDGGDASTWASLLDDLPVREQIAIALYAHNLVENNGDEDAVDDFDMSRASEVIEALENYGGGEETVFSNACAEGSHQGAVEDAYKALYSAIHEAEQSIEIGNLDVPENAQKTPEWDGVSSIVLKLAEVADLEDRLKKLVDERDNIDSMSEIKLIFWGTEDENPISPKEPNYGFSGWDAEAAIQYLYDNLEIEGFDEVRREPIDPLPDFTTMAPEKVREWIKNMYAKIPDGFIHKAAVDEMPETRLPDVAKGLWIKYYGKKK